MIQLQHKLIPEPSMRQQEFGQKCGCKATILALRETKPDKTMIILSINGATLGFRVDKQQHVGLLLERALTHQKEENTESSGHRK